MILAAGHSRRMGHSKALAALGRDFFARRLVALYALLHIRCCLVLGQDAEEVRRALGASPVRTLVNPDPDRGPLSSMLIALAQLRSASAVISHPVDHPLVAPSTPVALASEHRRHPDRILVPEHRGHKGHPVLFPSRFFPELGRAPLEEGARWLVRRRPELVSRVPVDDEGILANLNTPGQLDFWSRRLSSRI